MKRSGIAVALAAALMASSACSSDPGVVADLPAASSSASVSIDADASGGWLPEEPAPSTTTVPPTSTTSSTPPASSTTVVVSQILTGSIMLVDADVYSSWDRCYGTGGYADFGPGMNVTIRNESGTIIASAATANLSADDASGPWAAEYIVATNNDTLVPRCFVKFEVEVPPATFYEITIGTRSDETRSATDLDAQGWHVVYTLGN